ncbi:MAG: hypothetical protein H6735_01215 [Alphaproteobacteria bacterium]|nr:hypothetical protein [Alphaproteobacteria bacterium]
MWWWMTSAWAECTFRAGLSEVTTALDSAELAYVSLDVALFEKATTEVDFVVPCLEAPLDVATAARLHRLRGLGRFAEGDTRGAVLELSTARVLEPAFVFPLEMLPEGFELRVIYEGLPTEASDEVTRLPRPRGGSLVLDGAVGRDRADDRSVIFQRVEGDAIVQTAVLAPTDPVPWYPGISKRRTVLAVSSLATAAVATGFYAAALQSNSHLSDATSEEELLRRAGVTNVLGGIGLGLYGLAGVGGVAAVVVGRP